ncbi:multicopper oxidase family protein [Paenibacillus glycanilyticus]|uniref:multicopper oxidase family protein n=1 Tax=Paenibacillus glycanilyticus TaxID=126569 RepID=UPI00203D4FE8|nr:multicopper oxidase family protein [Paenibacillus glycanilyticus]MCM3627955.1 multicopper oxidase family protein [Paenibacillus glycanilyticus]
MYFAAISVIRGFLFLTLLLAWIAGNKASHLLFSGTEATLNRKARKLITWAVFLSISTAGILAGMIWLMSATEFVFWQDRLLIPPLLIIPTLMLWLTSFPRLRGIRQATGRKTNNPLDVRLLSRASQPAVVAPYQFVALGSLTGLYWTFTTTVPFDMLNGMIPLVLLLIAGMALWLTHLNRSSRVSLTGTKPVNRPLMRLLRRMAVLVIALALGSIPFYSGLQASRLPETISMAEGPMDNGTGAKLDHHHRNGAVTASAEPVKEVSVDSLTGSIEGKPDVSFTLTAEKKTVKLASGRTVEAWTYNGQIPGPELRFRKGQLVEVKLINKDITEGVTLHWHGLDVPNAQDGVAGATQNAVLPGEAYTYRFIAEQVGSFWYHSHQDSQEAVQKGLFGSLVVEPEEGMPKDVKDITVMTHIWEAGGVAIGDHDGIQHIRIAPGTPVRLRLTNTDDWVRQSFKLLGTKFQVAAIDGTDLHEPGDLANVSLDLITGGRYDVTFTMPDSPVTLNVDLGGKLGIVMSPDGQGELPRHVPDMPVFDPTHYGTPTSTAFDANSHFDREFTMVLDNQLGFFNGKLALNYTINGKVFPDTPMYMVREGELVKTTIVNRGAVEHPMHLHGHHMLVLSRNGEAVDGSPWWTDTLDTAPGEVYEVAFVADNPGLWMDHCHNLAHAAAGMTMHLMYEGITSPYTVGTATHNHPE